VTLVGCAFDGAVAELNKRSQDAESNTPMLMQPYDFRWHYTFHVKQHGVIEQLIIRSFCNDMILWYETTLITIRFNKHFMNISANILLWGSNILRTKLTWTMSKTYSCFWCAKNVDKMQTNQSDNLAALCQSITNIWKFKLVYLGRRIYIRFIRQQERQSFSVPISGCCIRWSTTILHTKLAWTMLKY
jgi:hypothetical protein